MGFLDRADQAVHFVYIAREVAKAEMNASTKALAAKDEEWSKLWSQKVWDESIVKSWGTVCWEAAAAGKFIRIGKLFGLCVEKGSELQGDDYTYRVVFHGNKVVEVRYAWANKGEVAAHLAARFRRKSFVLAVGDDRTDEDLFASLPRSAWTIRVGTGSTTARFRLSGPREVRRLLRALVEG